MSDTVNIPAKHDLSLFHRGAETTPALRLLDVKSELVSNRPHTIGQQALQSLSNFQLGVQHNHTKADWE